MTKESCWPAPATTACITDPSSTVTCPAYRDGADAGPRVTLLAVIVTPPCTAGPLITTFSRTSVPFVMAMVTVRSAVAGPGANVIVPATDTWNGTAGKADDPDPVPAVPFAAERARIETGVPARRAQPGR